MTKSFQKVVVTIRFLDRQSLDSFVDVLDDNIIYTSNIIDNNTLQLKYPNVISNSRFKEFIRGYSNKICSICLEEIGDAVWLPCGHRFCELCIKHWLLKCSCKCPICREDCN